MATPHHNPAHAPPNAHNLRVILVGRTGLDGRLRLDSHIELARVPTPLEAVGELSEEGDGAASRVVIVSADADPALASVDGLPPNPERAREFIAALRVVDPAVRVLRLEGADGEAPVRAGYDGIIGAQADADVLRAMIAGGVQTLVAIRAPKAPKPTDPVPATKPGPAAPPPAAPPEPLPDVPAEPIPVFPPMTEPDEEPETEPAGPPPMQPPQKVGGLSDALENAHAPADGIGQSTGVPGPMPVGMSEAGDEVLVKLLLQGRDITDAAMGMLRRRLPGSDLVFTSSGRDGHERRRDEEEEAPGLEVSVAWRGRQFGRLRSTGLGLEVLAPHAAWLGSWLALRDQHAQLRDAAFTDALTGAYNRRFFDHFLSVTIEQAREERRSLTVLMFDIDDFKIYNDRYGHAAGDEILTETVKLLRSVIRPSDKVCRIGGDEFVVIFHEPQGPRVPGSKHPSDIAQIAERFQQGVLGHQFPKLGREAPGTLTISGGLATYPWDGNTPESLLERADQLAFQSKRQGKNSITLGPGAEREHGAK